MGRNGEVTEFRDAGVGNPATKSDGGAAEYAEELLIPGSGVPEKGAGFAASSPEAGGDDTRWGGAIGTDGCNGAAAGALALAGTAGSVRGWPAFQTVELPQRLQ